MTENGSLRGRDVIVFGACGALGTGLISALADTGANIVGADLFLPEDGQRLDNVRYTVVDVLDEGAVEGLFRKQDPPWAVLNTIGGFAPRTPLSETNIGVVMDQFRLNAVSAAIITKHALGRMQTKGEGRIVHTASRAAMQTRSAGFAYSVSKLAVIHLVTMTAEELRNTRITINCIVPTVIDTLANRSAMPKANYAAWPKISDIADAYLFLISPQTHIISGAAIPV